MCVYVRVCVCACVLLDIIMFPYDITYTRRYTETFIVQFKVNSAADDFLSGCLGRGLLDSSQYSLLRYRDGL